MKELMKQQHSHHRVRTLRVKCFLIFRNCQERWQSANQSIRRYTISQFFCHNYYVTIVMSHTGYMQRLLYHGQVLLLLLVMKISTHCPNFTIQLIYSLSTYGFYTWRNFLWLPIISLYECAHNFSLQIQICTRIWLALTFISSTLHFLLRLSCSRPLSSDTPSLYQKMKCLSMPTYLCHNPVATDATDDMC